MHLKKYNKPKDNSQDQAPHPQTIPVYSPQTLATPTPHTHPPYQLHIPYPSSDNTPLTRSFFLPPSSSPPAAPFLAFGVASVASAPVYTSNASLAMTSLNPKITYAPLGPAYPFLQLAIHHPPATSPASQLAAFGSHEGPASSSQSCPQSTTQPTQLSASRTHSHTHTHTVLENNSPGLPLLLPSGPP